MELNPFIIATYCLIDEWLATVARLKRSCCEERRGMVVRPPRAALRHAIVGECYVREPGDDG